MTISKQSHDATHSPDATSTGTGSAAASAHATKPDKPATVLSVGPPLDMIGGMVSVIRETLSLSYGDRYRIEHVETSHAPDGGESLLGKVARHVRQLWVLRRAVRRSRARVIHIHTCSGFSFYRSVLDLVVTRGLGCHAILHIHGGGFCDFFAGANRVGKAIIRKALAHAEAVVALSESWQRALRVISPTARVVVIENAVAIPESLPRASTDTTDGRCHIIMLGPMDTSKGVLDALAASAALRNRKIPFRLTLAGPAGDVGDEESMVQVIQSLGLSDDVQYVGPVRGAAKTKLFTSGDVFLHPSHFEGMPMSILEALAHGLPVVGSNVGGIPEVIEHGVHGLLVEPSEPAALAEALTHLLRCRTTRNEMGVSARRLAKDRFGLDRLDRDLTGLYDALLGAAHSEDMSTVIPPTVSNRHIKRARV